MTFIKKKKKKRTPPPKKTTINKPTRVSVDDEPKIGISMRNVRQ